MTIVRPYQNKVTNVLNILSELNVSLGYSFIGLFLIDTGIDDQDIAWCILGVINITYLLHMSIMVTNLSILIFNKIKQCLGHKSMLVITRT